MKKRQLRKRFVKREVNGSVKQRPMTYRNLPRRTRLVTYRYVDDQCNFINNKTLIYKRNK